MFTPQLFYIDPSVMTYAIQAVVGVVIAVGAVFAIVWRKLKKKVATTMHLEEKSIKETEEDVKIVNDDENI